MSVFPADYNGSAFVTMHGSWNRARRTGYKVVRLLFDRAGKPTGEYEDFMTGFVISDRQVWGRPVGVAVAQDGSLFVTEDGNGTIWRVSHQRAATAGSSETPLKSRSGTVTTRPRGVSVVSKYPFIPRVVWSNSG